MMPFPPDRIGDRLADRDVNDLINSADCLERALDLDTGTLIRELTSLLERRRRFESLRSDFDVRRRRGPRSWSH